MADLNATGSVYSEIRQGSVPVRHTYVVSSNSSTSAFSTGIVVKASTYKPAIIEAQVAVTTADGGTTPTISVGYTASGYTDLVNGASTATAATGGTFLPASNATGKKYITTDQEIYVIQGGTPNGAGVTTVILDVSTVNTST